MPARRRRRPPPPRRSYVRLVPRAPFLDGRCASPSLRRHYPDQVQTVGGTSRPLSPFVGLPCSCPMVALPHGIGYRAHPPDAWIIRRVSDDAITLAHRAVDAFNEQGADIAAARPTPSGIYSSEPEIVPIRAALEGITYSGPTALDDFWAA